MTESVQTTSLLAMRGSIDWKGRIIGSHMDCQILQDYLKSLGQHISEISAKATKTTGFLRRNLAFAPRHTKEVAYKTLVRPQLEYAAPTCIWHPYHETQIGQVEKVQRTAAGNGGTPVALAICLTDLSGHPWRPAGSSLP